MGEAVIEISGLGVDVALARQITHVEVLAKLLQLLMAALCRLRLDDIAGIALLHRAAVVQQPDGELVGRVIHVLGRRQRIGEKLRVLVVTRHENIDRRPVIGRARPGLSGRQRHRHDDEAETQHHDAVHFREIKQKAGNEVFELVDGRQRACGAPIDITKHDGRAETKRHEPPGSLPVETLYCCEKDKRDRRGDQVRLQADRHRDDGQNAKRHKKPDNDCDGLVHPETFRSLPRPEFLPGSFAMPSSAVAPAITCIPEALSNRTDMWATEWPPAEPASAAGSPPARWPRACRLQQQASRAGQARQRMRVREY